MGVERLESLWPTDLCPLPAIVAFSYSLLLFLRNMGSSGKVEHFSSEYFHPPLTQIASTYHEETASLDCVPLWKAEVVAWRERKLTAQPRSGTCLLICTEHHSLCSWHFHGAGHRWIMLPISTDEHKAPGCTGPASSVHHQSATTKKHYIQCSWPCHFLPQIHMPYEHGLLDLKDLFKITAFSSGLKSVIKLFHPFKNIESLRPTCIQTFIFVYHEPTIQLRTGLQEDIRRWQSSHGSSDTLQGTVIIQGPCLSQSSLSANSRPCDFVNFWWLLFHFSLPSIYRHQSGYQRSWSLLLLHRCENKR